MISRRIFAQGLLASTAAEAAVMRAEEMHPGHPSSPESFGKQIGEDLHQWKQVIAEARLRLEA